MYVVKRDGRKENVKFDKVVARIKKQTYGLNSDFIEIHEIAKKVIDGMYDGISTRELDNLASETAASMISVHPDYSLLASRMAITSLYKEPTVKKKFSESIEQLYKYSHVKTGLSAGLINDEVYKFIMANKEVLDGEIVTDRDFLLDYFGFRTLERAYLLKIDGSVSETPQYMWMRVACGIWGGKDGDLEEVLKTYEYMSQKYFTHATPTLFNAGTKRPQLSSCFLLDVDSDSIGGIYKTLSDCAKISQNAGGIGIAMHKIRGKDAYIKGTNGVSNGIIPMLRVFNETARYVDQGGGKRKGSFAIYLEPWHSDIEDFLDLRKNQGKEEMRTRDLFTALWMPDLFRDRIQNDENWSLFSPDEVPGLYEVYGEEFNALYIKYESEGRAKKIIKARDLLLKIQDSQLETGTPYMLSKDAANQKSNQKNLGTIKSSNLCTEIMEYTDPDEIAVCNLASISLPSVVSKGKIDYELLKDISYQITKNLNRVIDINYYPIVEGKTSNSRHRPIGIGVQGLADLFAILNIPFTSSEAKKINKEIFETIYFGFLSASCELAKQLGPYETYSGSPISQGIFQFDMWEEREVGEIEYEANGDIKKKLGIKSSKPVELSGRWDWNKLRNRIKKYGIRNSLGLAPMPTASTSQILGNTEMFEPITSNIYKRNVLSGEFVIVNKYLVSDLIKLTLWNKSIKDKIIMDEGSIQNIDEIPQFIKEKYLTIWEIKQKDLIDMSADRGYFICQSQSFNLHIANANKAKLTSALMYAWLKGLKTLSYYTRTKSISGAIKGLGVSAELIAPHIISIVPEGAPIITMTPDHNHTIVPMKLEDMIIDNSAVCSLDNPDACIACSG